MGFKLALGAICIFFLFPSSVADATAIFNVKNYGAKADGISDSSKGIMNTWKQACASATPSVILIDGTHLAGPMTFEGPCKAAIKFHLRGTLKAPTDVNKFKGGWVAFYRIDHLTVSGGGIFDGQGQFAWAKNKFGQTTKFSVFPINIRFNFLTNAMIRDITSLNSKQFHMNVLGCKNMTFLYVKITAPENSPNTDGIHIGLSSEINITDTKIGTGDDCVSIGPGSKQITVSKVTCGPGHGISIGSLGKYSKEEPVEGIFVKNCTLTRTQNGVRIKTWPSSPDGIAKDMHFENIRMRDVGNPILIDQEYCPWGRCKAQIPSRVKISGVSFKNIRGTSSTPVAIKLACSRGMPCQNVEVGNINLLYNGKGAATSVCSNVKPTLSGKQIPPTCV